jgi:hypothetical protein
MTGRQAPRPSLTTVSGLAEVPASPLGLPEYPINWSSGRLGSPQTPCSVTLPIIDVSWSGADWLTLYKSVPGAFAAAHGGMA